ncbi:hypothetical protein AB0L86_04870 [Micromonospora musae]|uniref:hypothetical protein n=1 Tax=Micromonospora musae TaxID=1894970 RepID=UPI003421086E
MPKTTMTADEARTAAAEARAQAAEAARAAADLEAAAQEKDQAEKQRHDAAVADYWEERRDGFVARVAGKRSGAWQEFVDAVLNDGDTVAAFRRYRLVDTQVAEDKASIDTYYDDQARAYAEAETLEYHALRREAGWLENVGAGTIPADLDEAAERMVAFEKQRDEWNERHPLEPGMTPGNGINPPPHVRANASGLDYMESAKKLSYADAVDRVISQHVSASLDRIRQERGSLLAKL